MSVTVSRGVVVLVVLAALGLGAACRSQGSSKPSDPAGGAPASSCAGDDCVALATKLERQGEGAKARDTLRTGCETGSARACGRLGSGAYVLGDDDARAVWRKGCELDDHLSCVFTCMAAGRDNYIAPYLAELRKGCPDPRGDAFECQKLEELEEGLKSELDDDRLCDGLKQRSMPAELAGCPQTGDLEKCERAFQLSLFFSVPSDSETGVNQQRSTLCERGSAWACSQELLSTCDQSAIGFCGDSELAALRSDPDSAPLVQKVEQLCKDGVADACLVLPVLPEDRAKLCQQGHAAACEQVLSYDPALAEPACLQGSKATCQRLAELAKSKAEVDALFARICAANFPACLRRQETFGQHDSAMMDRPPIAAAGDKPCPDVVRHVRSVAGVRDPKTDPDAERFCATLSAPGRTCLAAAAGVDELARCRYAVTSDEAVRRAAKKLAEEAVAYFQSKASLPAKSPFAAEPACCGTKCPATADADRPAADPQWKNLSASRADRWIQLGLTSAERQLVATASGDWDCDGKAETYEARWSAEGGKVSRIAVTKK